MITMIGHGDRLGEPLGFVVTASRPDRIDVAPIILTLRVNFGITIDLGCTGQQEPRILGFGQTQRIVCAK